MTLLRDQAQADPEGDPVKWHAVLQAVKRALDLLGPLIEAASQSRVRELGDQVASATQAAERDANLLREVVDVRSAEADDPDGSASDVAYAQAFRDAGIDLDKLEPEAAGAKIKARPASVALALAAALDDWSAQRRRASPDESDAWKRLVATARIADPEPTRDRLRQLWSEPDLEAKRQPLLKLAKEADPRGWPVQSLILLAGALANAGEANTAADLLGRAQAEHPGDVWVNYNLADRLEDLNPPRTEEAVRFYSVARALRPETAHELAHALERQGRGDEAMVVFRDLTRIRSGNGRHWLCMGRLLQERGDRAGAKVALEEAVAALRETIRLKPDLVQAHVTLGLALNEQGKLDEAIAACREAIRLLPNYAPAHVTLSFALRAQGKLHEAIDASCEAIRLKPDLALAHFTLGLAASDHGKRDEAIAAYREAIRLKPDFADAHANLGLALSNQGKLDEAIDESRQAIRLKPDFAEAHTIVGYALANQGKLDEAIDASRVAIRLKPDYAEAHNSLGLALRGQGKLDEAAGKFREAIRLKPDYAEAHGNLGGTLVQQAPVPRGPVRGTPRP